MTTEDLQKALNSVLDAHEVLLHFHKEVIAFWHILDAQLTADDHRVRLQVEDAKSYLRKTADTLANPEEWTPKWLSRFYFEVADRANEANALPPPDESFNMGFVWIAANAKGEMPDCVAPECVFGIAHPGQSPRVSDAWGAARYGVWPSLDISAIASKGWSRGNFPENKGKFGKGGFWCAHRVPLVELTDEEKIRTLVTVPLRDKYAEVFRNVAPPQVAPPQVAPPQVASPQIAIPVGEPGS